MGWGGKDLVGREELGRDVVYRGIDE